MLKLGLVLGAVAFLYVSWSSWSAGYPPEIALLRGVLATMAVGLVGYVADLIMATAPSRGGVATSGVPAGETATDTVSHAATAGTAADAPMDELRRAA